MKIFTIDIGNTHTHCALVENQNVVQVSDFDTSNFVDVFDFSALKNSCDGIGWCSVVPRINASVLESLKKFGIPQFQLSSETSPIVLDVKNPEQVGQDRIAVAIGAGKFFKPPYIVADMGTAVTIDLVDEFGRYAGGAIAPGLYAFTAYLSEKTAQLPMIDPKNADFNLVIGKNTVEAMHVGCVKGFCKLADGIIADFEKEYFSEPAVLKTIFTGGSVGLLPKKWIAGRQVEPNLANIGLAMAFEMVSK